MEAQTDIWGKKKNQVVLFALFLFISAGLYLNYCIILLLLISVVIDA